MSSILDGELVRIENTIYFLAFDIDTSYGFLSFFKLKRASSFVLEIYLTVSRKAISVSSSEAKGASSGIICAFAILSKNSSPSFKFSFRQPSKLIV